MYYSRDVEQQLITSLSNRLVSIVLGPRQAGKTTLIERILTGRKGFILNMDIEFDRARLMRVSAMEPHAARMSLGNPEIMAIDEAQRYPEVGRVVKGWYDARLPLKIILLGSSSLDILDQTAEPLTGRNEKYYLLPLAYREIIKTQTWYESDTLVSDWSDDYSRQLEALLIDIVVYGSYPATLTHNSKEKYLLNLTADYLLKDALHPGLVKSVDTLKRLLLLLAYQVGSEVSISELSVSLGVTRVTVERYIDLLERVFVIFRLPAYSTNARKEITKSQKIYFWDSGVRNALLKEFSLSDMRSDIGHLWENWVIAEFAKMNIMTGDLSTLYFWRTRAGSEVDLIIKKGTQLEAYEIKWSKRKHTGASFVSRYRIRPQLIDRHNIAEWLLK